MVKGTSFWHDRGCISPVEPVPMPSRKGCPVNHSRLFAVAVASSCVADLRQEVVRQLLPAFEDLVDAAVAFALQSATPTHTQAFEEAVEQDARELARVGA